MTTPNGQHPQDPNEEAERPASTVLALDGWGPLAPEPSANGVGGEEHEPDLSHEPVAHTLELEERRRQRRPNWDIRVPAIEELRPGAAVLAPATAIGLTLGIAVGAALRWRQRQQAAEPPPPVALSRLATLRRSLALAIDPALAEPCPEAASWRDRLLDTLR